MKIRFWLAWSALTLSGLIGMSGCTFAAPEPDAELAPSSSSVCINSEQANEINDITKRYVATRLQHILELDQTVRAKIKYDTLSALTAKSALDTLRPIDDVAEYMKLQKELRARFTQDLSDTERDALKHERYLIDEAINGSLFQIVQSYGWPNVERIGGDTDPSVFLMHFSPENFERIEPLLICEIDQGRMPPLVFANAHDKYLKIRREPLLYGMGQDFDPATGKMLPPIIADLDKTNSAREELGLPEIEAYRLK